MFGLGWSEMLLISIVGLIVVGPKDLPRMFHALGQFTGKARSLAREFSRAMESAAKESGVSDIEKTLRAATNPIKYGTDTVKKSVASSFKPGGETEKLSQERAEIRAKVDEATKRVAKERKERDEAKAATAEAPAEAATPSPAQAQPKPKKAAPKPAAGTAAAPKKTKAAPKAASKTGSE